MLMKASSFYKIFLLICCTSILTSNAHIYRLNRQKKELLVRVLLDKKNSIAKNNFVIESNEDFILETDNLDKKIIIKDKKINLFISKNKINLLVKNQTSNKTKLQTINKNQLEIKTKNCSLKLNGIIYAGSLIFKINKNTKELFVINKLNLDEYIYSVLVSEIYQTWPHEMQKVQAVVSRSYATHQMQQNNNRLEPLPYHIKRNNFHQRYDGHHNHEHLQKAIDETKGEIITYNGKVALAMFDACCGGIIPAKMDYLDFKKAPYLARSKPCTFCTGYKLHNWKRTIPVKEFLDKLKTNYNIAKKIIGCGNLVRIVITKKDNAGIVKNVRLVCSKKNINLTGNQLWDNMKNKILSLNFNIKKNDDKIIIEGKGYGHQMGLCQWGSRELVKKGWDYKNIIRFYYPGIKFSTLKYATI